MGAGLVCFGRQYGYVARGEVDTGDAAAIVHFGGQYEPGGEH